MNRKQALADLIEKIEAGETLEAVETSTIWPTTYDKARGENNLPWLDACNASHGSLDAALALHEALLPGWTVRFCAFTPHGRSAPHVHVFRMRQTEDDPVAGANSSGYAGDDPARAWLVAILKAIHAQEDDE